MLAADGCASSSSNPACCFCGVWAPAGRGSGGRHVRALTGLGMLICRIERVPRARTYTSDSIFTRTVEATRSSAEISDLRLLSWAGLLVS